MVFEAEADVAFWVGYWRRVEWERQVGIERGKDVDLGRSNKEGEGSRRFLRSNIFGSALDANAIDV